MRPAPRTNSMIHECVLAGLLACVLGFAAWLEPSFMTLAAQLELSTHAFELALIALPMTLIIVTGGIDLSVGSSMALSAVTLGLLHEAGCPIWLAAAAAVIVGAAAGAINGLFVAKVRVHPLIVTLATLAAYRGLAEGISLGRPISGFPDSFLQVAGGSWMGVPVSGMVFLIAAIACSLAVRRSVPGLWVYSIGASERAARYCGVPTGNVKWMLYTLAGASAGLAGALFVARRNTAKADVGSGIELEVITAVVLGGTSMFGGRGTITGTILGVAIIHEVRELVSWHWQHDELILIVVGGILIGSVLLNNLATRKRG